MFSGNFLVKRIVKFLVLIFNPKRLIIIAIFLTQFISNDALGLEKKNFLTTKYNKVNIRNGPSQKYFVIATLIKKGLPLQRLSTFDNWVQIKDIDGFVGWVSKSQLSDKQSGIVTKEYSYIYQFPNKNSKIIVKVFKNVLVDVNQCKISWCKIEIADYVGWITKDVIWGVN